MFNSAIILSFSKQLVPAINVFFVGLRLSLPPSTSQEFLFLSNERRRAVCEQNSAPGLRFPADFDNLRFWLIFAEIILRSWARIRSEENHLTREAFRMALNK